MDPKLFTNYIDSGLLPSTDYTYMVYADRGSFGEPENPPITATTLPAISDMISFQSLSLSADHATLHLTGTAGQKFKIQSTTAFDTWIDVTATLTLTADMHVNVPRQPGTDKIFYRTIKTQ